MKYEYLDHPADVKFKAFGKSLEEAFENSAYAVFNVLIDPKIIKSNISKEITIKSKKLNSLLYDFLEELLFLLDSEDFLLNKIENIKIEKLEKYILTCTIQGDTYKDENYSFNGNVKSITYNDMEIVEKNSCFEIIAVVDI